MLAGRLRVKARRSTSASEATKGSARLALGVSLFQNELTRRIERKLRDAVGKNGKEKILQSPVSRSGSPDASSGLEHASPPATTVHIGSAAPV